MISPRSPSSRKRCSASCASTQRADPAGSASPSRSSVRIRPIRISCKGSRAPSPVRSQINDTIRRPRLPGKRPDRVRVQRSAVISVSRPASNLELGSRAELAGDEIPGTGAQARRDIVPADDEVLAIVGAAAHKDMDMGMLGVPMVDGDPVEPGAEIARGLVHQFARKAAQASQFAGIIG